jgi:signal transduction histidine kinase
VKNWFKRAFFHVRKYYPPFRNWHFWTVQLLAIPIAVLHLLFVNNVYFSTFQGLYFIPITLLVIPVVYAALTFGFAGSISTAIWVVILSVPNLLFGLNGLERVGEIFQMAVLVTLAIFLGQRVDREMNSRKKIEAANAALLASENKYQGLFSSSAFPVFILDKNSIIIDANPSAGRLLKTSPNNLKGIAANLLAIQCAGEGSFSSSKPNWWETDIVVSQNGDSEVYLEPAVTNLKDTQGDTITQVQLRDITEQHQRQAGLKAYTAYMLRAQEEERQHIARELHDETIQTLSLLCRKLDSVKNTCQDLSSSAASEIKDAGLIAEKSVKDLRAFTKSLRPPILDDLGVVASVRRLLVDFLDRTKIQGQFKLNGEEKRLPKDVEVGLYRIAQEALWNVEHHAQASHVTVTMTFNENDTGLKIVDDGTGFDLSFATSISTASSHLGLLGMQERAELFGGKMEIASTPGKGTSISVSLPVAADRSEKIAAIDLYWLRI